MNNRSQNRWYHQPITKQPNVQFLNGSLSKPVATIYDAPGTISVKIRLRSPFHRNNRRGPWSSRAAAERRGSGRPAAAAPPLAGQSLTGSPPGRLRHGQHPTRGAARSRATSRPCNSIRYGTGVRYLRYLPTSAMVGTVPVGPWIFFPIRIKSELLSDSA